MSRTLPNVNQKNIHPAFLVLHHEGKALTKLSPSDAWGSLLAFLHPASVQAEMVVINLNAKQTGSTMHERDIWRRRKTNARDEKTEGSPQTRENKPDAYLLQGTREGTELVELFVDHRDEQQEG